MVAPAALGAFGPLASFGPAGAGAGTIGLRAPAVAVDANGRVYVADSSDGRIEAFTNDGTADGGWGGLNAPSGVAAAPDGTIVVADRAGVYRFDAAGTLLGTLATTGDAFATPAGVAVGSDGTVYVADPVRHRVVALGGAVYGPVPAPVAVAVAADGSVFVADGGGDRIDVFSAAGAPLRSWAAHHPAGIALTSDGTVLVSDTEHDLLQRFSATGTSLGTTGDLDNPRGVATDCRDRAYVEDDAALRVHVFGEPGPPPPCTLPPPPPPPPVVIAPEPDPVLGTTARATAVSGDILVGEGNNLHELHGHEILPVGSTIDADDGHVKVELETKAGPDRDKYGRFMEAEFFDGSFTLNQTKTDSLANLDLIEDGDVARTRATSSSKRASKKALRLWGKAHGRFRTRGRNGAATVQGTQWLTSEHVDGTLFRVVEGVVAVKDFTTGKTIVLHPGESYLAKPPCVSRRAFRIRLRVDPSQIKNVIVTVRGKRVKVRRGSRLTAPVDLRGAPDGKVKVKIFARTSDGRVLIGERQYLTCLNAVRIPKDPPEL